MKALAFSLLTLLGTGTAALARAAPVAATAKKGTETVQFKTSAVCGMCEGPPRKIWPTKKACRPPASTCPARC
ncbi:MAG: hypothetical protein WKG07_38775 [Hymenobacter sp.]